MERIVANIGGTRRRETLNGREYIVAPITSIVPGILDGSDGPLYYPADETGKTPEIWNDIPLTVYHPTVNGEPASAREDGILAEQGIGFAKESAFENGKLRHMGWFDVEHVRNADKKFAAKPGYSPILPRLERDEPIEVSTGLDPVKDKTPGTHNGKQYHAVARQPYKPDHIAILPDIKGACAVKDGCGVNNAEDERKGLWRKFGELLGFVSKSEKPAETPVTNADESHEEVRSKLHSALRGMYTQDKPGCYIVEVHDDWLVYEHGREMYRAGFTLEDGKAVLGESVQVERKTTYEPVAAGTEQNEETDMPTMNANDRKAIVDHLVTNCACWKGPKDRDVLNGLPDEKLTQLKAHADDEQKRTATLNALQTGVTIGDRTIVLNAAGTLEDKTVEKPAPEPPVTNAPRLTAEEQEDLAFARAEKMRLKTDVVRRLTVNVADQARRQFHADRLMKKPLADLQAELELMPAIVENDNRQPVWLGATGGVPQLVRNDDVETLDLEVEREKFIQNMSKKTA